MKRNYSELIKDVNQRTLTAKGYKFIWDCIRVIAKQNNTSMYDPKIKPLKEKLTNVMEYLIFEEGKTIPEIKKMIKERNKKLTK